MALEMKLRSHRRGYVGESSHSNNSSEHHDTALVESKPHVSDPVVYDARRKVHICRRHGYAIVDVTTHLTQAHDMTAAECHAIVVRHQHEETLSPNQVSTPVPDQLPVPHLAQPIVGFSCNYTDCSFISSNLDHFRKHATQVHKWSSITGFPCWTPIYVQTIFGEEPYIKYFPVDWPSRPGSPQCPDAQAAEQELSKLHAENPPPKKQRRRKYARGRLGIGTTLPSTPLTHSSHASSSSLFPDSFRFGTATWTSVLPSQQAEDISWSPAQDDSLVMVLPTGGGEALMNMVAAIIESTKVVVIITLIDELRDPTRLRFIQAGFDCIAWDAGEVGTATVVVLSGERALTHEFVAYAQRLQREGRLQRVIFDQCHALWTSVEWLSSTGVMGQLRSQLKCPVVCLTATLPPTMVTKLEHHLSLRRTRTIRRSTIHAHHRYRVQRCRQGELEVEAVRICQQQESRLRGQKGVVYCSDYMACTRLAHELTCGIYRTDSTGWDQDVVDQWEQHGGLILAVSGAGLVVDYPGIVFVLHVGLPQNMTHFAQESGCAGRGGETVDSTILVAEESVERELRRVFNSADSMAMINFVTSVRCRRALMSEFMDGPDLARSCHKITGCARCDRCGVPWSCY